MREPRVVIVGGGAAGLVAAIASARLGATVTVLEPGERVGRKILASGNGRCNLTNLAIAPEAFNQPEFVAPVLSAYPYERVRDFFAQLGLLTTPDDEGRVYPTTNAAASVLDVLRFECDHLGVEVRTGFEVVRIAPSRDDSGFEAFAGDGSVAAGDSLVVATGGGSLLAELGHTIVEGVPVLGPIRTATEPIRGLSGVRVKCAATLLADVAGDGSGGRALATERGELLFRDYGVSGIMIFDLSRQLEPDCVLSIDLFPDFSQSQIAELIGKRCEHLAWRSAETFFAGMLHDRVARAVLRAAEVPASTPVAQLPQERLAALLKDFRLPVVGRGDATQSQVTRGGASVDEFDDESMESRLASGLFAAGEVLDVDGRSGGFNLHWAWASGVVAGEYAARRAEQRVGPAEAAE
ncbi:MAG: aminoacetone oxidase family FAD-binding enzyme [Coriobacteriia bacterium]|nr:aminoacetone oxidase family FAD-binding enzyme [Coriobacteriia bacterium]